MSTSDVSLSEWTCYYFCLFFVSFDHLPMCRKVLTNLIEFLFFKSYNFLSLILSPYLLRLVDAQGQCRLVDFVLFKGTKYVTDRPTEQLIDSLPYCCYPNYQRLLNCNFLV